MILNRTDAEVSQTDISDSDLEKDLLAQCVGNDTENDFIDDFDYTEIEREFLSECISDETIDNNIAREEIESIEIEKDILFHCIPTDECAKNTNQTDPKETKSAKKLIVKCSEEGFENSITLYFEKKDDEEETVTCDITKEDGKTTDSEKYEEDDWLDCRYVKSDH